MKAAERLAAIEKRLSEATEGPWQYAPMQPWDDKFALTFRYPEDIGHWLNKNDCEFITHAREDIPWLIRRVKRLEAALEKVADIRNGTGIGRPLSQLMKIARAALSEDDE